MPKLNPELRDVVVRGLGWSSSHTILSIVVNVATVVILSRILNPIDVGIVATAMGIVNILLNVSQVGAGPALIQRREIDRTHIGTALCLNLVTSSILIGVVLWSAPWLSEALDIKELVLVLPAISCVIILHTLAYLFIALAVRDLRFRMTSTVSFLTEVVGYSAVSVGLALAGFGLWAIVAGHIGHLVLKLIVFGFLLRGYFSFQFSMDALKDILKYGIPYSISISAQEIANSIDRVLIGGLLGASVAGLYVRSRQLVQLGGRSVSQPLETVLFPAMSKVQHDTVRLTRAYQSALTLIGLIMVPAVLYIAVASPALIPRILGWQWNGIVEPLQILAVGLFLLSFDGLTTVLARSVGKVRERAIIQIVSAIMVLVAIIVFYPFGLNAVCYGIMGALFINTILMAILTLKILNISFGAVFAPLKSGMILTITEGAMFAGFYFILGADVFQVKGTLLFSIFFILIAFFYALFAPERILSREIVEVRQRLIKSILVS